MIVQTAEEHHRSMVQSLLRVLLKWVDYNRTFDLTDDFYAGDIDCSIELPLITKADKLIANRHVWVDIHKPYFIQTFYEITKKKCGVWYNGVKQLKYLLVKGADPTTLLLNLWHSEPTYIKQYPEKYCLIRVLLKAGAQLDNSALLFKYICNPWEFYTKINVITRILLKDQVDDLTLPLTHNIVISLVQEMFIYTNEYLLDFMISHGVDPNIFDGEALKRSMNDYLCLMGLATLSPPVRFRHHVINFLDEKDYKVLSIITLIILVKRMAFKHIVRAYAYSYTIQPRHANYDMKGICVESFRQNIRVIIDVARPHVTHLRLWAVLLIQRSWRRANMNPNYEVCQRRLLREFLNLI